MERLQDLNTEELAVRTMYYNAIAYMANNHLHNMKTFSNRHLEYQNYNRNIFLEGNPANPTEQVPDKNFKYLVELNGNDKKALKFLEKFSEGRIPEKFKDLAEHLNISEITADKSEHKKLRKAAKEFVSSQSKEIGLGK